MTKILNAVNPANKLELGANIGVTTSQLTEKFKENPVEFLKSNLLLINNEPVSVPIRSGVYFFQIEPLPNKNVVDHDGKKINCCLLKQTPNYSDKAITAYYLSYQQDAIESLQLEREADCFFSAGLTGCGFAVENSPNPLVFHIDGEKYPNEKMLASLPSSENKRLYNDETYGHDHYYGGSSAIGARGENGWQFHGQAWYMKDLESYQLAYRNGTFVI